MSGLAIIRTVPLTQGKFALVDQSDYADLVQFKWYAEKTRREDVFYAGRYCGTGRQKRQTERMHRRVLGLAPGDATVADHINGNGLDNRRCNLRACDAQQNTQNGPSRPGTSRFKGVSLHAATGLWIAQIGGAENYRHLGYFHQEEDAARAYDRAAVEMFGEFARFNFTETAA